MMCLSHSIGFLLEFCRNLSIWYSTRSFPASALLNSMKKLVLLLLAAFLVACNSAEDPQTLRLATTTSTDNSGLLDSILPTFEAKFDAQVNVIAVGTGQALKLGEGGDADVILVHAKTREEEFVAAGHGVIRADVMYNDFIIVGPKDDPAAISGIIPASDAFAIIASKQATFASRGDDSGTHTKERSLWQATGLTADPNGDWYKSLGQGMGDTLRFANEVGAYTLTDRGTFLALQDTLPNLAVVLGGMSIADNTDETLFNPYGVIPINPDKGNIEAELAAEFVTWITSVETQIEISEFGMETYAMPLFYPNSDVWNEQ